MLTKRNSAAGTEKVNVMPHESFGNFLARKRIQRGMTLRKMAQLIGCSAPYLSDVEKGRRNPFEVGKLELAARVLCLTAEETSEMLDLAGKQRNSVAPDLPDYIMRRDYVAAALRTARDLGAGEKEWAAFVEELKRRKG